MERLAAHGTVARRGARAGVEDAILHGGGAQHAEGRGEIIGEAFDDDRRRAERQLSAARFAGADGHDEAGVLDHEGRDLGWGHLLEAPWRGRDGAEGSGHSDSRSRTR